MFRHPSSASLFVWRGVGEAILRRNVIRRNFLAFEFDQGLENGTWNSDSVTRLIGTWLGARRVPGTDLPRHFDEMPAYLRSRPVLALVVSFLICGSPFISLRRASHKPECNIHKGPCGCLNK